MNQPLVKTAPQTSALALMAGRLQVDPNKLLETLKSTCFKNASNEEMLALVAVANTYGLNPLLKELYAFPAKGGGIVPVVSVDGWIKMVNRAESFDGVDFEMADDQDGNPVSCTCNLHIRGRTRPVSVTEYYSECKRNTEPWNTMPRRMLRHKALIQCARVAFGFCGIHDEDDAIDISARVTVGEPEAKPAKAIRAAATEPKGNPHDEMAALLEANGLTFTILTMWGEESGNIPDATSYGSLADVPAEIISRLLKAKTGLLAGLNTIKEATQR